MPLSKWCQLTRDANVGRNAEKQHPTSITVRGGGCPLSVRENRPGRRGEAMHICLAGNVTMLHIIPTIQVQVSWPGQQHFNLHFKAISRCPCLESLLLHSRICLNSYTISIVNPQVRLFGNNTFVLSAKIKSLCASSLPHLTEMLDITTKCYWLKIFTTHRSLSAEMLEKPQQTLLL